VESSARSMFARCNVVDERDLAAAGERLSAFLTDAASALANDSRKHPEWENTGSRGTSAVRQPRRQP